MSAGSGAGEAASMRRMSTMQERYSSQSSTVWQFMARVSECCSWLFSFRGSLGVPPNNPPFCKTHDPPPLDKT